MSDRAPRFGALGVSLLLLAAGGAWRLWRMGLPLYGSIPAGLILGFAIVLGANALGGGRHASERGPRGPGDPRA
ncbi:MAG: hypothetical protein JO332_14720 [Planctomycetaceae bacterium]|nr:hypothetical protein [Planctomycetaceae bacterium]